MFYCVIINWVDVTRNKLSLKGVWGTIAFLTALFYCHNDCVSWIDYPSSGFECEDWWFYLLTLQECNFSDQQSTVDDNVWDGESKFRYGASYCSQSIVIKFPTAAAKSFSSNRKSQKTRNWNLRSDCSHIRCTFGKVSRCVASTFTWEPWYICIILLSALFVAFVVSSLIFLG